MVHTANIAELKDHLSEWIEKVEQGDSVVVCRRNQPVAEIHGLALRKNLTVPGFDPAVKISGDLEGPAVPAADWSMLEGEIEAS